MVVMQALLGLSALSLHVNAGLIPAMCTEPGSGTAGSGSAGGTLPVRGVNTTNKIVGGTPTVKGKYNWLVRLQGPNGHCDLSGTCAGFWGCAGTMISANKMVTAAHCRPWNNPNQEIYAHIGYHNDAAQQQQRIRVYWDDWSVKPGYVHNTDQNNDIAVITLRTPSMYNEFAVLNAPSVVNGGPLGTTSVPEQSLFCLTVAGWGSTAYTSPAPLPLSDVLLEVNLPVVSESSCKNAYNSINEGGMTHSTNICAGYDKDGKDSCIYDSGGALFAWTDSQHALLVGVVSYGYKCAIGGMPGSYSKVSAYEAFLCQEAPVACTPYTSPPSPSPTALSVSPTSSPTSSPPPTTSFPTLSPTAVGGGGVVSSPSPTAAPPSSGGVLNFGGQCSSGKNYATVNVAKNSVQNIGTIPKNRYGITINIDAAVDLDIQLLDESTNQHIWKASDNLSGYQAILYKGMVIKYSGIDGTDYKNGNYGKEWVVIEGSSTVDIRLEVAGYVQAGSASVIYRWEQFPSACCKGTAPCTETYTLPVNSRETLVLGTVPVGVGDLVFTMTSTEDVDIILRDIDDTSVYPEGKTLAGFCTGQCNTGPLVNNNPISTEYWGNTYTYSGYGGKPGGSRGDEDLKIYGYTNRRLSFGVFGFTRGTFTLSYSYYMPSQLESQGGFDFGTSCKAGSGKNTVTIPKESVYYVGLIPKEQRDVVITTQSSADVDIRLSDYDEKSVYYEGKALIGDCGTANCNKGILHGPKFESTFYKGMTVQYSGFEGEGPGKYGNEKVTVAGEVQTPLLFSLYAFGTTTTVDLEYAWDESQSRCCQDLDKCTGTFNDYVPYRSEKSIGTIPVGKGSLRVSIKSVNDLDIRLYDIDDTTQFPEGRAIVSYCVKPGCNSGINTQQGETTVLYKGISYKYSGFNGVGGNLGDEYIEISGKTNTRLEIKAFAVMGSEITAEYSYWYSTNNGLSGGVVPP